MRLHNIIREYSAQPRTLRPFLRGKKRLQDFVFDLIGDARAVVFDFDGYIPVSDLVRTVSFGT
jgi:hypothetical protein